MSTHDQVGFLSGQGEGPSASDQGDATPAALCLHRPLGPERDADSPDATERGRGARGGTYELRMKLLETNRNKEAKNYQESQRGGVWSLSEWSSWAPITSIKHPFVTAGSILI